MKIVKVTGREVLDSRGNPTVEAEVVLEEHLRLPEALKRDGLAEDFEDGEG